MLPGDASLARLFRDYGDAWEIEKIPRSSEWVAGRRDPGDYTCILAAHDLTSLRHRIKEASKARTVPTAMWTCWPTSRPAWDCSGWAECKPTWKTSSAPMSTSSRGP